MRVATLALIASSLLSSVAQTAPIVEGSATQTFINVQQIRMFAETPFNPGPVDIEFPVTAWGKLTASWEAQSGNTMQHAVPDVHFFGALPGLPPTPFEIIAGTPGLPPTTGQFSNIVQDPNDPGFAAGDPSSLVSADYANTAYFAQVIPGATPSEKVTVYSDQVNPAVFTGTLGGLPYPIGQQFISTGDLNLYLQLGATADQNTDLLIGQSLHRLVEVVPTQVVPFNVFSGDGIVHPVPSTEGQIATHDINAGVASMLGNYTAAGLVRLDMFTSAATADFSSAEPVVFTGDNGDELVFHYGRTDFGAATPGEVSLVPTGEAEGEFVGTWLAEFTPVVGLSTGQFESVVGGSFIMTAVTEPFIFGSPDPVAYSWHGEGSLEMAVPEPTSALLALFGMTALGLSRRRRRIA